MKKEIKKIDAKQLFSAIPEEEDEESEVSEDGKIKISVLDELDDLFADEAMKKIGKGKGGAKCVEIKVK